MDLIFGIIVFVTVLFLLLPTGRVIKKLSISLYKRVEKFHDGHMIFSQKLLIAGLTGFIVYSLFTQNINSFVQKIAVISIAAVLIFAVNISFPSVDSKD
jgi:hypothetical protein